MLGFLLSLAAPFLTGEKVGRNMIFLFLGGILVDLIAGWTVGLTNLFVAVEILFVLLYQILLRLRIRVKVAIAVAFGLIYHYVSRRIFL